jgi:uncharacterized protein
LPPGKIPQFAQALLSFLKYFYCQTIVMKKYFLLLFVCACVLQENAQELRRRALLGIQMESITEDKKRIMELPSVKGVLINKVVPKSSAEKAGLQIGDVLLKINGEEVNTPDAAVKLVGAYRGGDDFNYELIRKGKVLKGKSIFTEYPKEQYTDFEMEYTSVKTSDCSQRIIISKPKNIQKAPVIFYIGGIGCYSLDNPLDTSRGETQLLNAFTRAGYVCIRAEKPGVGDNTACKSCSEISFNDEMNGYVDMIRGIKKLNYVDSSRIFIFGHSMGGVMGPLVAQRTPVAGIIAYGTIGSNFMEYLLKTRRTIGEAYNWAPDETDDFVKDYCECASYYFVDKLSVAEASKKNSDCDKYLSVFTLRSRAYNDQLYELNIPLSWKPFTGKALLLWGEGDFIASKEDHQIIANTVNFYHPGNGTFSVMEKSTHSLQTAANFQEAQKNPGSYNKLISVKILTWLKTVS